VNFRLSTEEPAAGVVVVALVGEVDPYTAPELKKALIAAIEAGARRVIVDLTETTFIDSTTLGVLIGGVKRLRPEGGDLAIVVSDYNIRKIFEITLLDRIFAIFDTRDDALAAPAVA
jgi:anti-sigma B factor antagonist